MHDTCNVRISFLRGLSLLGELQQLPHCPPAMGLEHLMPAGGCCIRPVELGLEGRRPTRSILHWDFDRPRRCKEKAHMTTDLETLKFITFHGRLVAHQPSFDRLHSSAVFVSSEFGEAV
jgi:hypothetical protein